MSRRNGDKARWSLQRKRRVTQRISDRARRIAAAQAKPVVKVAKPPKPKPAPAPEPVAPPPPPAEAKKPRAKKAAPPAE